MKSTRNVAIIVVCAAVIAAFCACWWLPPMMKAPSRAERFDTLSKQELRNFYQHLDTYRETHAGKLPGDLNELNNVTGYFRGLAEDARNKRMSEIEYPSSGSTANGKRIIAAYQIASGPRFLLLESGEVVKETDLTNNTKQ